MSELISAAVIVIVLVALPLPYMVGGSASESASAARLRRAPVTALLVGMNVAVFLATHLSLAHGLVEPVQAFNDYGVTPAAVRARDLVTYEFLHISGAHLLWNMAYLYLFGPPVEEKVGSLLFGLLYIAGGALAGLINAAIVMHAAANSSAAYLPVVGASGAISAVLGLFAIFAARRPLRLFWAMGCLTQPDRRFLRAPAIYGIAVWLAQTVAGAALTLANNDAGGVAYFTHIGGFVAGIGLGVVAQQARRTLAPAGDRRKHGAATPTMPSPPGGQIGLLDLLARALDDGDVHRANALYLKCRSLGTPLPPGLLERLRQLKTAAE